ncbi:DUF4388 domain-containing protein [Desulfospira joergensenii]|uniref:DUF4388 domain-containing protein n=1 Tax=Desulfospira joergensenii TaxID=53329 RepID=UPI0003B6A0C2|nr:DUF4388 domain-containing protein [Desulfospira joergensenii]
MESENSSKISGRIAGVNISSFLQMIEMEQQTCTVNVFIKKNMGQIFFHNGVIVDASTRNLKQVDALYDILSWKNFILEVEENRDRKHNVVNLPLMHIIMESARREDENGQADADQAETLTAKNIPLKTMSSKEFCLEIGIKLLVDFEDLDLCLRSTLVGIEHGKYLLLKAPVPFESLERDGIQGGELIIKSLYKGTIYAFRSRLMALISEPSRLMFIQYPERIEHHELRAHKRFRCSIVAQARVDESERGGVIENISMGGCRCAIESFSSDQEPARTLLQETIPFRCRFPGTQKEVRFMGQVKNTQQKTDEVAVGVEFMYREDSDETRAVIDDYIRLIEYSSENV